METRQTLVLAASMLLACGAGPQPLLYSPPPPSAAPRTVDCASRIDNAATWAALANSPTGDVSSRTEVVKFVIDYFDHDRVYFLQTSRWEIHYYFIRRYLGRDDYPIPAAEPFWQREYLSNNRRFVQGAITHYLDQDVWALELIAQDVLDVPRTVAAFHTIHDRLYVRDLKYHPIPRQHLDALDQLRAAIPVVTTDELFLNRRYQPLNPGEAFGYLRFFDHSVDPSRVRPSDIVVLAEVPLDLPVCAGVITSTLQTPLSHIAVLSSNRGTPNMALRDANHDPSLRRFDGQLVRLHVSPQDFTVTPASQSDAERAWSRFRPGVEVHLPRRIDGTALPRIAEVSVGDLATVGAKAAQLGELAQIQPPIPVPRAFAIPFHFYAEHLRANGLDNELSRMLADSAFQSDPLLRERRLAEFRVRISTAPIDAGFVHRVALQIAALFPSTRVRFRSSTNAEDLPGFNGAGLYESLRSEPNPTEAQIADLIRRVWASTWTFQGFEERNFYRIAQSDVAMGILVQESIDDDQAVGVAITANPFNQGRPGYFINAQLSAGSVTSAATGEISEQDLFYTYPPPGFVERVAMSSRTHGAAVLSDNEVIALSGILGRIQSRFYQADPRSTGQAMDVEFLFAGPDRHPVIVQARPFTVRWTEGREYPNPPRS